MMRFWRFVKYALPVRPLIILLFATFIILLPLICWNLENSSYFIKGNINRAAYIKRLKNNKRIAEARSYFNENFKRKLLPFDYQKLISYTASSRYLPKLAFIVLATNRDTHKIDAYEPKYLTQTMHHLFASINKDVELHGKRWSDIFISMCNIDDNATKFYEIHLLTKYFDSVQIKPLNNENLHSNCPSQLQLNSCISLAMNKFKDVDKFVIIEDDLLANKDLLTGLSQVFNSLQKRFKNNSSNVLGYVQLYYPKHEARFSLYDSSSMLELILISSALVLVLYAAYFRMFMRSMFILNNILLIFVLLSICATFAIAIGRPHWRSMYHQFSMSYSLVEPIHRSVAANLLDRQFMKEMLRYDVTKLSGEDNCKLQSMTAMVKESHRRILSVNFNLFKHIGLYSAFKKSINDPYHID